MVVSLHRAVFTDWTSTYDIYIDYIEPGCPYQDAYIEQFNPSYRNDVLDCYLFNDLNEVCKLTED